MANGSQQGKNDAVTTHLCTVGKLLKIKVSPRMPERVCILTQGDPIFVDQRIEDRKSAEFVVNELLSWHTYPENFR